MATKNINKGGVKPVFVIDQELWLKHNTRSLATQAIKTEINNFLKCFYTAQGLTIENRNSVDHVDIENTVLKKYIQLFYKVDWVFESVKEKTYASTVKNGNVENYKKNVVHNINQYLLPVGQVDNLIKHLKDTGIYQLYMVKQSYAKKAVKDGHDFIPDGYDINNAIKPLL